MKIKNLEPIVLEVLERKPVTRDDDFLLYGCVLLKIGYQKSMNLFDFLRTAQGNAPTFESVSRVRRHICEIRQDLRGSRAVERDEAQEDYKLYNLSNLGEEENDL